MALQLGQVIDDKYRILRVIGEGGMGAVYEGENLRIRRRVAIKLLHAGVASNTEMVQRFEREAQVAGTVGNDHILEILDLGAMPSGERYMVMEYLDGETLTERIKARTRLPASEAVAIARQVLRGLTAAHAAGIVHRDLKPDNIFILKEKAGQRDFVKIIDFGISKFAEQGGASSRMTRTGALMGTPHYMAPEQATGSAEIDRRTDIYAVGIIFYEMVTGRVPFQAETFNQLLFEIALAKIIPARQIVPDLDSAIDSIIMKASARQPVHRFQTAQEFISALDEWEKTGRAVTVPPEQSAEAIVAATVPRTGQHPSASPTDATLSAPLVGSGTPVPAGSQGGARAAASAPPVQPTLNSWANTPTGAIPKSNDGLVVAATIGALVVVAGGIGAYFLTRPSHAPEAGGAPSSVVASPAASASPSKPEVPSAAPTTAEAATAPAATGSAQETPSVSPSKPQAPGPAEFGTSAAPHVHHVQHEGPQATAHPPAQKPESKKPAINFGY